MPVLHRGRVDLMINGSFWLGTMLGAILMIGAGVAQWLVGVEAAGRSLEDAARPLTAEEDAEAPA